MKLAFIDVDGTLTDVSSPWQDIHEHHGLWQKDGVPILNDWLAGRISYDDFCIRDVDLWNSIGLTLEQINSRFDSYPIKAETVPALQGLLHAGWRIYLLSTGFTHIGKRIVVQLSPEPILIANTLHETESGGLTVRVNVSGDQSSSRSKAAHVRRICDELGVDPFSAVAIGDGPSDAHMFDACGRSYLVDSGEQLFEVVSRLIHD